MLSQRFLRSFLGHTVAPSPEGADTPQKPVGQWFSNFSVLENHKESLFQMQHPENCSPEIYYVWMGAQEFTFFFFSPVSNAGDSDAWLRNTIPCVPGWNLENADTGAWSLWEQNAFYQGIQYFSPQGQNQQISNI